MVRYVHPGEELATQIKRGVRAADVANTATGTEKARTRDSTIIGLLDEFAVTSSPTVEPSSGWSPVAPPWVAGEYVWKRTTTTYGDGATAVGPALLATGNDGAPGDSGVGVVSVQPLFKAATNHAPSLYGPTVPVEVRRNLVRNPRPTSNWGANGSTSHISGYSPDGWVTVGVDGVNSDRFAELNVVANNSNLLPSTTYTLSGRVRVYPDSFGTGSQTNSLWVYVAGALIGYAQPPGVNVPGEYDLSVTFTTPAVLTGLTSVRLYSGRVKPADWTNVQLEISPIQQPFFDGNTSPDPDMTARWLGTPNASASVLEGQHPVGFTDTNCVSIIHEVGDGSRELRLIATSASAQDSFVSLHNSVLSAGATALGTVRIPAVVSAPGVSNQRFANIVAFTPEQPAIPHTPRTEIGSWEKRGFFTTTGSNQARFYKGGSRGSGDVYWSDIGLYAGDLFDYDTWQTSEPNWVHGLELWRVERITYSDDAIQYTEPTRVTSWDGIADAYDNTVIAQEVEYAVGSSETVAPTTGWSATQPTRTPGSFIWMRIRVTYGDQGTSVSAPTLVTGNVGAPGTDGRGIASTAITYQAGVSGTTAPTGTWSGTVPSVPAGQFLWTRTIFTYTSGTPATTTEYSVGRMGENGAPGSPGTPGSDGRGVTGAVTTYQASASGTAVPTGAWLTTPPAVSPGQFLWSRTVTSYTSGADTNAYSVAQQGATGAPGTPGVSVSSSTVFYWLGATQPAAPTVLTPPAPWSATEPTYTPGTSSNLYVVVRTVLSSGAFSYSAVSMSASFAAAKSAFGKYTFSAAAPVVGDGTGKPVGAMWVRKNGVGEIDGYWEWSGSAWQARPLSQEIIPLIVAGMISAGAIDGMTITGAVVRTAASGARVQMDAGGIKAFDAANNAIATIASGAGGALPGLSIAIPTAGSVLIGNTGSGGPSVAAYGSGAVTRMAEALVTDDYSGFGTQHRGGVLRANVYDEGGGAGGVAQILSNRQINVASDQDIRITPGTGKKIALFGPVEFQGDRPWARIDATTYGPAIAVLGTGFTHDPDPSYDGLHARIKGGVLYITGRLTRASFAGNAVLFTLAAGFRPGRPAVQYAYTGAANFAVAQPDGTTIIALAGTGGATVGFTIPLD